MFKKKGNAQGKKSSDDFELVLLKTIDNNYELDLIKGLLDEHKIPCIVKDYGTGGHMRLISGSSLYRTDMFVDKLIFEQAKCLLDELLLSE